MMPIWFVLSTTLVGGIDLLTGDLRLDERGDVYLLGNMPVLPEKSRNPADFNWDESRWSRDTATGLTWTRTDECRVRSMDNNWWELTYKEIRQSGTTSLGSRVRFASDRIESIKWICPSETPNDSCQQIRGVTLFDDRGRTVLTLEYARKDSIVPWGEPDTLSEHVYDPQGRLLRLKSRVQRVEIVRDAQGAARQRIDSSYGQRYTYIFKPGPGEDTVYVSSYNQEPQALVRRDSQGRIVTMLGNGGRYLSEGIWFWNDSVAVQWGMVFPVSACRYALESRPGPWKLVACDRWDPQGHILEEYESSPWFNRTSSWFYQWDANGRWIRKSRIDAVGDTLQKIERRYEEGSEGISRHSIRLPRTPLLTKVGDHLELGPVFDRQKVTIRSPDGKVRFQCTLESGAKITLPFLGQGVWVISGSAPAFWSQRIVTDR